MTRVLQPPNTGISMGWGWARDEAANAGDNVIQGNWVNGATGAAAAVCDSRSHVPRNMSCAAQAATGCCRTGAAFTCLDRSLALQWCVGRTEPAHVCVTCDMCDMRHV